MSQRNDKKYPKTIEAAVALVLSRTPDDLKGEMSKMVEFDFRIYSAAHMLGMNVRAMLGLWGQNPELSSKIPCSHPDDASEYILLRCWKELRSES